MRLTDIVSGAGLAGYAEVALVVFLLAFIAVVWWVMAPSRRKSLEQKKNLPFENGESEPKPTDREGKQS